jgi:hypothetical protein
MRVARKSGVDPEIRIVSIVDDVRIVNFVAKRTQKPRHSELELPGNHSILDSDFNLLRGLDQTPQLSGAIPDFHSDVRLPCMILTVVFTSFCD